MKQACAKPRIAIIGAGAVGSTVAYALTIRNLAAEIMLIDVNQQKEEGEVMDINNALCFVDTGCVKTADFKDARNADVIIITAGVSQRPGDTRLDLFEKNANIMRSIFQSTGKLRTDSVVLVVSNPVDVLTYLAQEISGLPTSQVFGSGTTLDTARMRSMVAKELDVSAQNIHGYVLGEHGDSEFVAWSTITAGGVPINKLLNATKRNRIEKSVRNEAYEIIHRKGSTFYGIGLTVTDIVEAIMYDQQRVMPITTRLDKYNGISGVCLGAPAVIGRGGVLKHWPIKLTPIETKELKHSATVIKGYIDQL